MEMQGGSDPPTLFQWVWGLREVQLLISSVVLIYMIYDIHRRNLHIYTTLKLFMFVCVFYLVGMLIVVLHIPRLILPGLYSLSSSTKIPWQCVENERLSRIWCGGEAFINLFFYNLAYFFAVLITVNVYQVLHDNHREFMKRTLLDPKIIAFLTLMLINYLLPWIFLVLDINFDSYCPAGFNIPFQQEQEKFYVLYCGINQRCGNQSVLSFVYSFPVLLFIGHSVLLYLVWKKKKQFLDVSLLNSKQKFIINSGNVSFAVFIVQLINFLKSSVISLINQSGNAESLIIIIINFLFDLYPLFFFYKYREYLGQMDRKKLLNATLISEDDIR